MAITPVDTEEDIRISTYRCVGQVLKYIFLTSSCSAVRQVICVGPIKSARADQAGFCAKPLRTSSSGIVEGFSRNIVHERPGQRNPSRGFIGMTRVVHQLKRKRNVRGQSEAGKRQGDEGKWGSLVQVT
jgi:hypothetical protein